MRRHRSVSFSSIRRLRRKASSVLPGSSGWNSPKPAATRRCGDTPLLDEVLHHRDRARGGQRPVRGKLRARDRPHVGVAVDAQHPGDVGRDLLVEVEQRAGELVELGAALRAEHRLAGVEEHFGLEHEAVADDADVRPVAEDLAQPAEEVGAIAREFLHPLGQRHVEPLAEIGDPGLGLLVLLLRGVERLLRARRAGGAAPRSAG